MPKVALMARSRPGWPHVCPRCCPPDVLEDLGRPMGGDVRYRHVLLTLSVGVLLLTCCVDVRSWYGHGREVLSGHAALCEERVPHGHPHGHDLRVHVLELVELVGPHVRRGEEVHSDVNLRVRHLDNCDVGRAGGPVCAYSIRYALSCVVLVLRCIVLFSIVVVLLCVVCCVCAVSVVLPSTHVHGVCVGLWQ